ELKTGPLDLAVFFLDDGVLAGDVAAVAAALAHVQQRGESLGLQLNLSKCETITAGSTTAADLHPHFPSELLRFVAAHTDLEDLQVGVKFDSLVRACFAGLTGLHLDANQWAQAARGLAQVGSNSWRQPQLLDAQSFIPKPNPAGERGWLQCRAAANARRLRHSSSSFASGLVLLTPQPTPFALAVRECWTVFHYMPAERAGFRPEPEKPGLLLPQRPDDTRVAHRRPADIYLPSLYGTPAALDLAVTAPQRQESLGRAGQHALAAATAYAEVKSSHLDTARVCAEQGLKFVPMVAEAT
ncbi:unnamed protein product, partial [Symbiodinium microadriaticum]